LKRTQERCRYAGVRKEIKPISLKRRANQDLYKIWAENYGERLMHFLVQRAQGGRLSCGQIGKWFWAGSV
jgi:hypothetical protein